MTEKEPTTKVEVAHITGIQGIRAAMDVLAREADQDRQAASSMPGAALEDVPLGRRTCSVCAADNDGSRETCWNCGASLRRPR